MPSWLDSFVPAWTTRDSQWLPDPCEGQNLQGIQVTPVSAEQVMLPDHNVLPGPILVSNLPGHTLRFNQVGMLLRLREHSIPCLVILAVDPAPVRSQ